MTAWNVATVAVAVVLMGGFLATPFQIAPSRAADPSCTPTADSIYVAATGDYGYTPDTFNCVPTNATITVTFVDNSTMAGGHTFTILGEPGVQIPNTDTQTQIDALAWGHTPRALVNLNVSEDGDRNVSAFQSPGPGWYEFVCATSGHFQNGMYGFIAFGMSLPSNLTLPSRVEVGGGNLTFSPIDAAVIGALVVVFVLGYVVLTRRRARLRMPQPPAGRPGGATTADRPSEERRKPRDR